MKPFDLIKNTVTAESISRILNAIKHPGKKPAGGGLFKRFIKQ